VHKRSLVQKVVRALEETGNPNALSSHEEAFPYPLTLLQEAVVGLDPEAVALLLERGADPGFPGRSGVPPLHYLVADPYRRAYRVPDGRAEEIFALLVAFGADPRAKDRFGFTLEDRIREAIGFYRYAPLTPPLDRVRRLEGFLERVRRAEEAARERLLRGLGRL